MLSPHLNRLYACQTSNGMSQTSMTGHGCATAILLLT